MSNFDIAAAQSPSLSVPLVWLDAQLAYQRGNAAYAQRLAAEDLPEAKAGQPVVWPDETAIEQLGDAADTLRGDAQLNYVVIGAGSGCLHRDGDAFLLELSSSAESRLLRGLAQTGVALWNWDIAADSYHWSGPAAAIFGRAQSSMPLDHGGFLQCVHGEDRAGLSVQIATALSHDSDFDVEFRLIDGVQVVQMRGHVERDASGMGRPTSVVGVCWDVTERRQSERRVREMTLALEYANKQLVRSNHELEEFAYIASHDLKAPLRGIHNYAQFLSEDYGSELDDEGQRMLASLGRQARDMERLIEALLRYSRLGRQELDLQPVALDEILDMSLERLRDAGQLAAVAAQ